MPTQADTKAKSRANVQFAMPAIELADAAKTAEIAMDEALVFAGAKAGLPGPEAALNQLRMGTRVVAEYWRYGLAQQIAHKIGELDSDVKAVYVADYDATAEDLVYGDRQAVSLIHLIVWVGRRTAALTSLLDALDRALVAECVSRLDMDKLTHLLDAQIVDDVQVNNRTGYGALLASAQYKPIQIWQRD